MKTINKDNFHKNTFAIFKKVDESLIKGLKPDYISEKTHYVSFGGELFKATSSEYYYTKDGVYRYSEHWGYCRSCMWILEEEIKNLIETIQSTYNNKEFDDFVLGFCSWDNFYNIIEKNVEDIPENTKYFALEFKEVFITRKKDNITPIIEHPNHKANRIKTIDISLDVNSTIGEQLFYYLANEGYCPEDNDNNIKNINLSLAYTAFYLGYKEDDILFFNNTLQKIVLKKKYIIAVERNVQKEIRQYGKRKIVFEREKTSYYYDKNVLISNCHLGQLEKQNPVLLENFKKAFKCLFNN